ncbi:glycoside hydrolase family 71 protein [Xylariaceae sp. FL0255]|nr:glycoside hydrolase family 71 protein [Xylariaceae sp. FL0255]
MKQSIRFLLAVAFGSDLASCLGRVSRRSVQQGWSLQSSSCLSGSSACSSGGACCPSSLFCIAAANDEVAACCTSNSACRGSIEGQPGCADTSWSLWQGFQGNDFCCQVGLVGVYSSSGNVAGTCVASGAAGTATTARLVSTGTGATVTSSSTSSTRTTTSTKTTTTTKPTSTTTKSSSTTTSTGTSPTGTGLVFAHYLIGTVDSTTNHAQLDVQNAMAAGIDAFALNQGDPSASWSLSTLQQLFTAAEATNGKFKLFFSFDTFQDGTVSDHVSPFLMYKGSSAYLLGPNGLPVVSSYGGYSLLSEWQSFKDQYSVYLIPNLDVAGAGDTSEYYTDPSSYLASYESIVDGYFSWESAWPQSTSGVPQNVSSTGDATVMSYAHSTGKTYMMGLSSLQFKDCCGGYYYRIGESNLPQRMTEILQLRPDFTEVITWNDAGESHYIGNVWNESLTGTTILNYANTATWPHNAWQPLITSFIAAYKAGVSATQMEPPGTAPIGAMWYRPNFKSCSNVSGGPPANAASALDAVNYAVVMPQGTTGASLVITSGSQTFSSIPLNAGLNYGTVEGMQAGPQSARVVVNGATSVQAKSVFDVQANPSTCNFNYFVVGFS